MRTITVVTGSRADYGIYGPILREIARDSELDLEIMVTGSHLSPAFGYTVRQIELDGYKIRDRIECLMSNDSPWAVSQAMAIAMLGFAQAFARSKPELLLVMGDRYEMFAATASGVALQIPTAHVHGGETTEGAIDEAFRHAMTKMSHLHFAATAEYRDRIIQLGEEPWRVKLTGAPSLDNLRELDLFEIPEIEAQLGWRMTAAPILVTFHPVTVQYDQSEQQVEELLLALEDCEAPIVFTYPNADTHGHAIIRRIEAFVAQNSRAIAKANLGTRLYFSLMRHALVMVGNSSSGIIEAASFGLPVVNIGIRQFGRVRGCNVIDCDPTKRAISESIRAACEAGFRKTVEAMKNPYGDGFAARRIVSSLRTAELGEKLLRKHFYSLSTVSPGTGRVSDFDLLDFR